MRQGVLISTTERLITWKCRSWMAAGGPSSN
jgi:hypothetical protein